jgi:hypothetical protein
MLLDKISVYQFWMFHTTGKSSYLPVEMRYKLSQIEQEYFEISHKNDLFRTEITRFRNKVLNEFAALNGDIAAKVIVGSENQAEKTPSTGIMDVIVSMEKIYQIPIDPMQCPMTKFQAYINNAPKPKKVKNGN